jgi:hypothetical protein
LNKGRVPPVTFLLLAIATGTPLEAQTPARAPGGTLNGVVRDSATGRPIGYALVLVVGKEQRVFASESGRFTLTGLGTGAQAIRVQQIGYRALTLVLKVDTSPESAMGAPGLEVTLSRRPMVLPEIVVHGDVCTGTESMETNLVEESILDEAFKNAERILAMEKSYPFRGAFQQTMVLLDANLRETTRWIDTIRYDTRQLAGYHRGGVLGGRRGRGQVANYFMASDLAREEFRKSHCFWYAGRDNTMEDFPGHRIAFAPLAKTKSTDWAGWFVIDTATMTLFRSEAHLVNLKSRETTFTGANCVVLYREIVATLVLEMQADCRTTRSTAEAPNTVERWRLIDFRFVDKSPVKPGAP